MAFSVFALGLKVPLPPLQVPLVAPLPSTPASWTCGVAAHVIRSGPAFTDTAGLMAIVTASLAARVRRHAVRRRDRLAVVLGLAGRVREAVGLHGEGHHVGVPEAPHSAGVRRADR